MEEVIFMEDVAGKMEEANGIEQWGFIVLWQRTL
jgi:hypothetical protein